MIQKYTREEQINKYTLVSIEESMYSETCDGYCNAFVQHYRYSNERVVTTTLKVDSKQIFQNFVRTKEYLFEDILERT